MNEYVASPQPTDPKRSRKIALGVGGGLLLLLLCCCLAVLIIIFVDPFNLDLLSRFSGGYDAPATAMPADTDFYMSVNLLNLRTEKANRIVAAFAEQAQEADVQDTESLIEQADRSLQEEIGMTLTDDVLPWIGQYAGFGLMNLEMSEYGGIERAGWVVAVEARDTGAADEFLEKLRAQLAEESSSPVTEEDYQGVKVTAFEDEGFAFARSQRLVLFGASLESIHGAIEAQKKDSLSASPGYKNMAKQLPGGRALTLYIDGQQFQEVVQELAGSSIGEMPASASLAGWREMVISLSIVDAGLQLDSVYAVDPESLSEAQKALMESSGAAPRSPELFPENTLLYIRGQHLDLAWQAYREVLGESLGGDADEAMEMFRQEVGFNPDSELFPYLDGEWAIGVMPSTEGLLAHTAGVDLGFAVLAEVSDAGAIRGLVDGLRPTLEEQGAAFQTSEAGGITFTELGDPYSGDPIAAYCVSDRWLALGSTGRMLEGMFGGGQTLARSARYAMIWQAFPKGMSPALYVDLQGFMSVLGESLGMPDETLQMFSPIQYIASASQPLKNGVGRNTVIVFIPTE